MAHQLFSPKTILIIIVLMILSIKCPSIEAAEKLRLTLEDAITLGIKNSLEIKAKELALSSSLKDIKAAKAGYYPGLSLSSSYSHSFKTFNAGGVSDGSLDNPDQIGLSFDLSQPLYTFGRLKTAVLEVEKNSEIARHDLNEKKRSLAVEIQRAFYGFLLASEALSVKKQTLSYKEEAVEIARARYEAGLTPRYEVLKAESELKSFIPELIEAQNEVEYALLNLKEIVGIKKDVEVEIEGRLDIPPVRLERDVLLKKALIENTDIKLAEMNLELQYIRKKLNSLDRLPEVSGNASLGLQSGFNIIEGDVRLAPGEWSSSLSTGIRIRMGLSSIFPWSKEKAEIEKSVIEIDRLQTELKALQSNVSLKIERLFLDLSKEIAKVDAGITSVKLAEELFKSSKEMFENGLISSMEYADAQIGLDESRISYLTSFYDYRISLCDLMDVIGVDHL